MSHTLEASKKIKLALHKDFAHYNNKFGGFSFLNFCNAFSIKNHQKYTLNF